MKHAKMNNDEYVIIVNENELEIINNALNNRMVRLQKIMENKEDKKWAYKCWEECLDLQIEMFKVRQ